MNWYTVTTTTTTTTTIATTMQPTINIVSNPTKWCRSSTFQGTTSSKQRKTTIWNSTTVVVYFFPFFMDDRSYIGTNRHRCIFWHFDCLILYYNSTHGLQLQLLYYQWIFCVCYFGSTVVVAPFTSAAESSSFDITLEVSVWAFAEWIFDSLTRWRRGTPTGRQPCGVARRI